jgi:elongator complex protein 3
LLANAELYEVWQRGEYLPYTTQQLIDLIVDIKPSVPRYCRINRVIRDIPSNNVVEGNKRTSLRQDVQSVLSARNQKCVCIRCREVRSANIDNQNMFYEDLVYETGNATEHFLSFNTTDDKLAGFLRLSLPANSSPATGIDELTGAALIREVHVYGQSLPVGIENTGFAQHSGLGTKLLEAASEKAIEMGYNKIAVISAIGTRKYYMDRGFERAEYYLIKKL